MEHSNYPIKTAFSEVSKPKGGHSENDLATAAAMKTFLSEVSIVGMKYVTESGNIVRRIIWLTLVLFGIGFMLFQLVDRC